MFCTLRNCVLRKYYRELRINSNLLLQLAIAVFYRYTTKVNNPDGIT